MRSHYPITPTPHDTPLHFEPQIPTMKKAGKIKIGVLGPGTCTREEHKLGYAVGAEIAKCGAVLVCGGLGGVMAAAAEGARNCDGLTVGILPDETDAKANPHIDISIPTGLGPFRNMLVVRACDAVIAIRGGYGTLSEIAFALRLGVPVIGLNTWAASRDGKLDPGIHVAQDAVSAVRAAFEAAGKKS